jgi:2-methylcitrate dehydratase PrpD
MSAIAPLAEWVAGLRFAELPEPTVRAAVYQVLNMVAAAHGAARWPDVRAIAAAPSGFAGQGRATVLATGDRLGPADAALANAACSMGQDFDDIIWMGHTCHSAVFASLAVAEHEAASVEDFLTAVVAANEVSGRLAATCFFGPLNGQMMTHLHLIGAAAATARLLRLDATRTAHALAIALAQPPFALQPGFMAPSSKLLAAATPTATGIQAAYFARAGMTGAPDILEDERGLWSRFAFIPLPFMLEELGDVWLIQTLTMKSYPGCHYFQTASAAVDELLGRLGNVAPRVQKVKVETTKLGMEVSSFARGYAPKTGPIPTVVVNFDLATTVAVHLLAGRFTGDEMEPAWLAAHTPQIRALLARTRVTHDPALTVKVIEGGAALGVGRRALSQLKARDLVTLIRRYRAEYASTLITPAEVAGWLKVGLGKLTRRRKTDGGANGHGKPPSSAVPLYFPNRVTLELTDGQRESAEIDLPPGSFAAPTCEGALEKKFLHETRTSLGALGAARAWRAGLDLPVLTVARFVEFMSVGAGEKSLRS